MKKNYFCGNNMLWQLILIMMMLVVSFAIIPASAVEKGDEKIKKSNISVPSNNQNALCKKVTSLIKSRNISKYLSPMENIPDTSRYRTLDIDGDGIPDKVEVSSGSAESYCEVKLSSGAEYDLVENGSIMIINIDAKVCALVTYWEYKRRPDGSLENKEVSHRLYLLTKQNAEMLCDNL
ncbi:MAG: hypothetical protein JW914_10100 [Syntrophaceae bacterium]|nr:hypothetical protein [Syntrophaceae bacterium]